MRPIHGRSGPTVQEPEQQPDEARLSSACPFTSLRTSLEASTPFLPPSAPDQIACPLGAQLRDLRTEPLPARAKLASSGVTPAAQRASQKLTLERSDLNQPGDTRKAVTALTGADVVR